ncbi:CLVS2 [Branchiostoma lanceolatum]|uniref:CLVS2 protein n=1 Tax=Branchiostoma lanceolatum TaxID=7740 RepID=A0A8J9Z6W0_BRALA|nr:CLVS2 [Branchiostoma lanceolatum]
MLGPSHTCNLAMDETEAPEMIALQDGLSEESKEKAQVELNEHAEHLHNDIQAVRDMVITRPDIAFLRSDDSFVLRFLRARKFSWVEAFMLYARYYEYRQKHSAMFKCCTLENPGVQQALLDGFPGVLEDTDHFGRKILVFYPANWDVTRYSIEHVLLAILISLEQMIQDAEVQVHGFAIIVDWSQFSFRQAARLSPAQMRLVIEGLQDSFPARFGGIHFINQPWYIDAAFTILKPFLKEKTRERILMHGNNMKSLHDQIHPEILPSEFGGQKPPYNVQRWGRLLLGEDFELEIPPDDTCHPSDHHSARKDMMKRSQSAYLPEELGIKEEKIFSID